MTTDRDPQNDDPLTALADAGFELDAMTEEQIDVLRGLTQEEVGLLVSIRQRLDAVEPEVQAHCMVAGASLF